MTNEKISGLFAEIFGSEELLDGFMKIDDIDELYEYCLNIKGGYTIDEFKEFLMNCADHCEGLSKDEILHSLSDEQIEMVSGGVGSAKKWISGSLAALSLATSVGVTPAGATDQNPSAPSGYTQIVADGGNNNASAIQAEKSWKDKFKDKMKSVASTIWNNKGKIALGFAAAAAVAVAIGGTALLIWKGIDTYKEKKAEKKAGITKETKDDIRSRIVDIQQKISVAKKDYERKINEDVLVYLTKDDGDDSLSKEGLEELGEEEFAKKVEEVKSKNNDKYYKAKIAKEHEEADAQREIVSGYQKDLEAEQNNLKNMGTFTNIKNKLENGGAFIASVASIVGGLASFSAAAIKGIANLVDKAGSFTKSVKQIAGFVGETSQFISNIQAYMRMQEQKMEYSEFNKTERTREFEERLKDLKGQKDAIDVLRKAFYGTIFKREFQESASMDFNPQIFVLNGTAGVGKSMGAKIIADTLSVSKKPFIINAKNDLSLGESAYDNMRTLFDSQRAGTSIFDLINRMDGRGGKDDDLDQYGNLAQFVHDNPKGVVVIDEYDKVTRPERMGDGYSGRMINPLDDVFHEIYDKKGKLEINGREIDLSGITFILTTNETTYSLSKNKTQDLKIAEAEELFKDSSRTHVDHEGSFVTRIIPVEFHELSVDEYTQIAKQEISAPLRCMLTAENCKYKSINIKNDVYEKIGRWAHEQGIGARAINKKQNDILGDIANTIVMEKMRIQDEIAEKTGQIKDLPFATELSLNIDFDEQTGEFKVEVTDWGSYKKDIQDLAKMGETKEEEQPKA